MVLIIITALVFAVLLEFNKNSILGWILAAVIVAGYLVFRKKLLVDRAFILRFLGFLVMTGLLTAVLLLTPGPYRLRPAVENVKNPEVTGVITVKDGQLTGVYTEDRAVEVYAGIPYAAPPVGELRWKEPQDPEKWEGVRACDHFAPMGYQPANSRLYNSMAQIIGYHDYKITLKDNYRDMMSEDSLYLNIWKPAGDVKDLPVLVYVHGGSLMTGQPWYEDYSGQGLARKGVIVVNMGYRLGVFGFYADPELAAESPNGTTGNYGLLDQIKALEWVQENIAAFGGDPDNVTISGESAGSACVSALAVSPLAKGLFRRVIAESSTVTAKHPAHSWRSLEDGYKAAAALKEHFHVSTLEELRALPAEELVYGTNTNHHMTVDGYALEETPYETYLQGKGNAEAIMHGYNRTEGKYFILFDQANLKNYEQKVRRFFRAYADEVLALFPASTNAEAKANWEEIYSVVLFTYGHYVWTGQALAQDIPVYEYYFTRENGRLGATHSGEEVYFYGNIPAKSRHYDDDDRALSETIQNYVVNFMKYGDPNGDGTDSSLPAWQPVSDRAKILELNVPVREVSEKYMKLYDVLDRMAEEDE